MKRYVIAVAGVGVACVAALAGPLNKNRVDAAAKWVVHADLEAVMASRTGRFIAAHKEDMDLGPLEEFKKRTGLDTFTDIKDVTVYGTTESPDQAVAMIHGNEKIEAAVKALMAEDETVAKVELAGRTVFRWREDGADRFGYLRKEGAERVFMVSKAGQELERALEVMDGEHASLAMVKEGPMMHSPRKGAMVFVAMKDLESAAASHAPKMLRTAKSARAELGEDDEGLYGEVRVTAGAAEDARNIADFAKGLIALGKMASQSDPELKDLAQVIDGVKIEAAGTELSASFRIGKELLDAALSELKEHAKDHEVAIERPRGEKDRKQDKKR